MNRAGFGGSEIADVGRQVDVAIAVMVSSPQGGESQGEEHQRKPRRPAQSSHAPGDEGEGKAKQTKSQGDTRIPVRYHAGRHRQGGGNERGFPDTLGEPLARRSGEIRPGRKSNRSAGHGSSFPAQAQMARM